MSTNSISFGSLQLHAKKPTNVQNQTQKPASWDPFRWTVTKLFTTDAKDSNVKTFFGKVLGTICTLGLACTVVGIPLLGRAYIILREEQAFESGKIAGTKKGKKKTEEKDKSDKSSKGSKKYKKEIAALKGQVAELTTKNRTLTTEKADLVKQEFESFDYNPVIGKFFNRELDLNNPFEKKISSLFLHLWQAGVLYEREHSGEIKLENA